MNTQIDLKMAPYSIMQIFSSNEKSDNRNVFHRIISAISITFTSNNHSVRIAKILIKKRNRESFQYFQISRLQYQEMKISFCQPLIICVLFGFVFFFFLLSNYFLLDLFSQDF